MPPEPPVIELDCGESWFILSLEPNQTYVSSFHVCLIWLKTLYESWLLTVQLYFACHGRFWRHYIKPRCVLLPMVVRDFGGLWKTTDWSEKWKSLERPTKTTNVHNVNFTFSCPLPFPCWTVKWTAPLSCLYTSKITSGRCGQCGGWRRRPPWGSRMAGRSPTGTIQCFL